MSRVEPTLYLKALERMRRKQQTKAQWTRARSYFRCPMWMMLALAGVAGIAGLAAFHSSRPQARNEVEASQQAMGTPEGRAFGPTIPNKIAPPAPAPNGMVWIPGGEFSMGAMDPPAVSEVGMHEAVDARPIHRVYVDGYWMDKTDVTNEEFARFVKATNYVTLAERTPTAEEFPGAPAENLVAGSVVFSPPNHPVPLNNHFQWWSYVRGANWRHPEGPGSDLKGREKFPVVQVAYADALAYAKWASKRLPTEAEWEFAARGGLAGKRYPWGDEFQPNGKWMANTFQGHFPSEDTGADGHVGISPVAQFPPKNTASTTWPGTSGNGPATGIAPTTIGNWQQPEA
jgi:formylglycine-generating enzyme